MVSKNAKKAGLKIVYDKSYPPSTTDFSPIVRALQAANADIVVVCSYPNDSVGMLNAIKELNYKPNRLAQSLKMGTTRTIGVLDEDLLADHLRRAVEVHGDEFAVEREA